MKLRNWLKKKSLIPPQCHHSYDELNGIRPDIDRYFLGKYYSI